ncbi:hypothetical protein EU527_07225 [Candidatus Thorarchaeota archaeon]|nr:MAG: hypothetical protein EU527_07225 [Candidatus Thorarchaeota archaeon]
MNLSDINAFAILEVPLKSKTNATILYNALLPETESISSDRAISKISLKDSILIVQIEANDLTALRASLNSYTAWIEACISTLESVDKS